MHFKLILLSTILFFSSNAPQTIEIESKTVPTSFENIAEIKAYENLLIEDKTKNMTNNFNKEICLSYLKKYAEKDLNSIEKMFSEDIVLRDWKIRVEGKENAIIETRKNFESADSIEIEVLATYGNENTVAAELKITVNSTEELYVVDVITINSDGKIQSIRAYLGRGDN
uniref:nuclear transport factor 2 family protein n=2 Tax=Roseivirga sp. TaxID=1964215 RepID=UPI00404766AA